MYLLLCTRFIFLFLNHFFFHFAPKEKKKKRFVMPWDDSVVAHRCPPSSWCTERTVRGYWTPLFEPTLMRRGFFCLTPFYTSDSVSASCIDWLYVAELLFPVILNVMVCVVLSGPKLLAALLAGHATPHAPCPRLPDGGEHSRCVWLHPVQGHLWGADAHRPASTAW